MIESDQSQFMGEGPEPTQEQIDAAQQAFDEAVNAGVEERLAAMPKTAPKKGQNTPLPQYLQGLAGKAGLDVFEGVDVKTGWLKIKSMDEMKETPIAFLNPNALETLQIWGFEGHTEFEILNKLGGETLGYFACVLEDLDRDDTDANGDGLPADAAIQMVLASQTAQLKILEAKLTAQTANPLAGLEVGLDIFEKIGSVLAKLKPNAPAAASGTGAEEIVQIVATILPMLTGGAAPPAQVHEPTIDPTQPQPDDLAEGT